MPYDNDTAATLVERTRERLTGFTAGQISEIQRFAADTNQTTIKVAVDLANKRLTITTNVAQSTLTGTAVLLNGLLQTGSSTTVAQATTHSYDSPGREIGVRDPLGNLTRPTIAA